jgi:hypothetical protein
MAAHHLRTLNKFFGDIPLHKIHIGHLDKYQIARVENMDGLWRKPAGAEIIRHELSVVHRILKRAELWGPLTDLYKPMRIPVSNKKKVLDEAEERHLFAVAASRPEWEIALLVSKLGRHTSAVGTELRH